MEHLKSAKQSTVGRLSKQTETSEGVQENIEVAVESVAIESGRNCGKTVSSDLVTDPNTIESKVVAKNLKEPVKLNERQIE